ncbi:hypothetical protein PR202_ga03199 [Eleusine coracana subsp. coracana]|uniref:ENTH domain-containing protein n=1 Tax=Eleusine coracana subsp. coracana TaxID=191504 RepID=A0AAV5BMX5_ELECO|nr:hypothetical protein PR202_ga03199 [Eleusine coracana subsp. coracana]
MAGGATGIRKYVGALKDTTTVSLAKVNSDYKELDIAIVKATNHVENPSKEKYIRDIFYHLSAGRPRADVAYCIRALGRRLSKTRNWAVALKTLIVIHRALREVDPTFREELISYGRSSSHMLNLSYFKDDSSAQAWDYSAWVALESVRIQTAIYDGILNLVDKFFEMQRDDAIRALDIYKRAINQAEQLSEFYELCKSIHIGRGERLLKIEQPPASFVATMEEYVSNAPLASTVPRKQGVLAIEYKRKPEVEEPSMLPPPASGPPPAAEPESEPEPVKEVLPTDEPTDLLGMNESTPDTSETIDQKNALALAIVRQDNAPKAPAPSSTENVATSWELALVTAPSSSGNGATSSKLAGGLDLLTLDSLYNEAHRRAQQNVSYNPWETISASGQVMQQPMHDPFYASNSIATARNVQMATMAQQQQAFMLQQQHMMMMAGQQVHHQQSSNPFTDPYMYAGVHPHGAGMQLHAGNTYTGTRML